TRKPGSSRIFSAALTGKEYRCRTVIQAGPARSPRTAGVPASGQSAKRQKSLVTERVDRVEPRRFAGRVEAEENSNGRAHGKCQDDRVGGGQGRPSQLTGHQFGATHADTDADG